MNARLVFACALTGAGMVLAGGGIASAEDPGRSISFSAAIVTPGDLVEVEAFCDDPEYNPTPVVSDILDPAEMREWTHTDPGWHLKMTAKVRANATPEIWPVSFVCDGETVSGHLKVDAGQHDVYAAIGVQDEVIVPGQEVLVVASCQRADFTGSPVTSPVLKAEDLVRKKGDPADTPVFAEGRIDKDVAPGTYELSFTCVDRKVSNTFTVTAADEPDAQVRVKPRGAPETGEAAPASGDRPIGTAVGLVAVLLGAGGFGVSTVIRRRRA
jgi:hypothetical protein